MATEDLGVANERKNEQNQQHPCIVISMPLKNVKMVPLIWLRSVLIMGLVLLIVD